VCWWASVRGVPRWSRGGEGRYNARAHACIGRDSWHASQQDLFLGRVRQETADGPSLLQRLFHPGDHKAAQREATSGSASSADAGGASEGRGGGEGVQDGVKEVEVETAAAAVVGSAAADGARALRGTGDNLWAVLCAC